MGFRDDNEALRARIRSLESKNDRLEDEKSKVEDRLKEELNKEPPKTDEDSSRSERIQAFMWGEGGDDVDSILGVMKGESDTPAKSSAKGGARVTCTKVDGGEIIHVSKPTWRAAFKTGWMLVPAVALGGVIAGLEGDVPLSWTLGFVVVTVVGALAIVLSPPKWRLEIARNRFEVFKNDGKKPVLEGSLQKLNVRIHGTGDGPYHAEIGLLSTGDDPLTINQLSRSDGHRLRDALERAGKKRTM